jgi:uncharacterized protein YgiM (DUF1202 family)
MKLIRKLFAVVGVLTLGVLACTLPTGAPTQVDPNAALTEAVATLQAETQTAATPTSAPTSAATSGPPTVTVSSVTNCRTGPSTAYDLVMTFDVGMTGTVVAKYSPANYWIINYPGGGSATCWLWGQYATVIGDTSKLQEAVPPPMPPTLTPSPTTAVPPFPPKNVSVSCTSVNTSHKIGNFFIISYQWTVTVTWKDNTNDAGGFYVYKDGSKVATLGTNARSYTDQFSILAFALTPQTHTYGVAAFNQYGSSTTNSVDLTSCK